jgi:phthalate 4,5-dioxygenase oxygenase subunit
VGPPVRVRLLGENLVAFRDSDGRIGLLDEYCPHRRASLFFGRNEGCGLRCVYHGWKFAADIGSLCPRVKHENSAESRSYVLAQRGGSGVADAEGGDGRFDQRARGWM